MLWSVLQSMTQAFAPFILCSSAILPRPIACSPCGHHHWPCLAGPGRKAALGREPAAATAAAAPETAKRPLAEVFGDPDTAPKAKRTKADAVPSAEASRPREGQLFEAPPCSGGAVCRTVILVTRLCSDADAGFCAAHAYVQLAETRCTA